PGIVARARQADRGRLGPALVEYHPGTEALKALLLELARDLHEIRLREPVAAGLDRVCKFTVVGNQQQSFAVVVEASYRIHALPHALHVLHHRGPLLGIGERRHAAARLVEHQINALARRPQQLAFDLDVIALRVGLTPELAEDF